METSLSLLGLREGSSPDAIHAAYRDRVRLCHPDLASSDADRARRTRATVRLNAAYAELRQGSRLTIRVAPPRHTHRLTCLSGRPWISDLCALTGAIVAGVAASTVTGDLPLSVGGLVAGTVLLRWAHIAT